MNNDLKTLIDRLEDRANYQPTRADTWEAAAELRRLAEERDDLNDECARWATRTTVSENRARAAEADKDDLLQLHGEVIIERDALLEALKYYREQTRPVNLGPIATALLRGKYNDSR